MFGDAYEKAGLTSYSYTPSSTPVKYDDWPTLQTLISAGSRAVTFLASGADTSTVPYILDECASRMFSASLLFEDRKSVV